MTARTAFTITVIVLVLLALLLAIHVGRKAELEVESHGSEVGLVVPGPVLEPTTTTAKPVPTTVPRRVVRSAPIQAASVSRPVVVGEIADLIRSVFGRFGADIAEQAVRVAQCESHLNPRATNGSHVGLFQISGRYHQGRVARLGFTWSQMYEAGPNTTVAADLFGEQGWRPWACARIVGVS